VPNPFIWAEVVEVRIAETTRRAKTANLRALRISPPI
jgi:hypothetical protein